MQRAAERLAKQGHQDRVVLEPTSKAARGIDTVLGYYAWGSADSENRVRKVWMAFMPGSIAANLASFDARTFKRPPEEWVPSGSADKGSWFEGSSDTLIGDLIRDGVTGVAGQVGEAYVMGAVRPEILFPAYLAGFNLAESFYLASPTLSWQQVVIGDPLTAPFRGQDLTREITNDIDPVTGLPAQFAKRRLASLRTTNDVLPDAALEMFLRGETLLLREDRAGARDAFEKASTLAPKSTVLLLLVADLEEKAAAYDTAIERYRRVLELQPGNVVALNNLAYALAVRRNQPAEALPLARRAASLAPRLGTVLDTLGWIEHLLGNHAVAVNVLADAVRYAPAEAEIRLHSALANAAAGRSQEAARELERALKLDPSLESREEVRRLRP
jgi:Tfp pilus assembly protein PilF